jgi:cytoplasmic iron level regulating protein YaaA (DUF328/UPF0246 family)
MALVCFGKKVSFFAKKVRGAWGAAFHTKNTEKQRSQREYKGGLYSHLTTDERRLKRIDTDKNEKI